MRAMGPDSTEAMSRSWKLRGEEAHLYAGQLHDVVV